MANIFRHNTINRLLLAVILLSFTLTYSIPLPAQQNNAAIDQVAFLIRIEKLVEKLIRSKGKSNEKIISCFVDIKDELENSFNMKFNVDQSIDNVQKEIQKSGVKTDKKQFDAIKKMMKKRDKKNKKHALYLADVMYVEGYEFNESNEKLWLEIYDYSSSKSKDKEDKEDKEEVVLPAFLIYGVTVSLCGMFLMIIPFPGCKEWGSRMVVSGIAACASSLCSKTDENNQKEKDEKKNKK